MVFGFRLLERVVDGDWKRRMSLLRQVVKRYRHPVEKELFSLLLAAVAVWRSHEFLGLRNGDCGEQARINGLQRTTQPDVEKI